MIPEINFRFEFSNLEKINWQSFQRDKVGNFLMEQQLGFRFSQVLEGIIYYHENNNDPAEQIKFYNLNEEPDKPYIIPTAVQYCPSDWTDLDKFGTKLDKKSFFELLNPIYLKDLQNKKALLLIDQSVEGYSDFWLWDWFHKKCNDYNISPSSIIYCTGDQSSQDNYNIWCQEKNVNDRVKIIPSISLTTFLHKHYIRSNMETDFLDLVRHKEENKNQLFLFDCINMRPRKQRIINYLHLVNSGLIDDCNISMPGLNEWEPWLSLDSTTYLQQFGLPQDIKNKLDKYLPPKFAKHKHNFKEYEHFYQYVERILSDMYKNSWVSLVVESSYFEDEYSVFISEKTFKPIACMQPFLILGSRHSLKYLKKLGFKTFHPFIDESYDEASDNERFIQVLESIKKIKLIENKVEWYKSMQEILEHNFKLFKEVGKKKSLEHIEISKYYFDFFY